MTNPVFCPSGSGVRFLPTLRRDLCVTTVLGEGSPIGVNASSALGEESLTGVNASNAL